jgi:AcrR family transcriptional regulator
VTKQQKILDTAFEVFMRYGYRRARMDDLTFPNKAAILRAVLTRSSETSKLACARTRFTTGQAHGHALAGRRRAHDRLLRLRSDVVEHGAQRLAARLAEVRLGEPTSSHHDAQG